MNTYKTFLRKLLLVFSLFIFSSSIYAFHFQTLSISKGMSSREICDGILDTKGYLWFASRCGVDCYDGSNFTFYSLSENRGIRQEHTKQLVMLSSGQIFASTEHDIYTYKRDLNQWHPVFSVGHQDSEYIISLSQTDSTLWIGTNTMLYRAHLQADSLKLKKVKFPEPMRFFTVIQGLDALCVATEKGVWKLSSTRDEGSLVEGLDSLQSSRIQSLYFDEENHYLWIGTFNNGLWIYNTENKELSREKHVAKQFPIRSIASVDSTRIWTSVDGSGLYVWDRQKATLLQTYTKDSQHPYALPTNSVYSIIDTPEKVWITTFDRGVLSFKKNYFVSNLYQKRFGSKQSLVDNTVNAFLEDSKGRYWIGTNNGLDCYTPQTGKWIHYLSSDSHKNHIILALAEDQDGAIYVSGYATQLYRITPDGTLNQINLLTSKEQYIYSIYIDSKGLVWMGGIINPLLRYNPHTGEVKTYPIKGIQQIESYHEKKLLLATNHGLYTLDNLTGITQQVPIHFDDIQSLHNVSISGLCFDPTNSDMVWLGVEAVGVVYLNLKTNKAIRYDQTDGLSSNVISAMTLDKQGRVWVSTFWGLNCIDSSTGQVEEFYNLGQYDDDTYNPRAVGVAKDGLLFFGSSNGLLEIDPARFKTHEYPWAKLRFSKLMIANQEVQPMTKGMPLVKHIDDTSSFTLSYDQRSFALSFVNVNFDSGRGIRYSWRLKGFDEFWTEPSIKHEAVYTNIPPGDYIFEVKAIKAGAFQGSTSRKIMITVAQPIWKSGWAYILYIVLIGGLIYMVLYSYKERIDARHSDDKIRFFINMAHDIRTPLTLVQAPLIDLKCSSLDSKQKGILQLAIRNTEKLTRLVNQLLNFQRTEREASQLHVESIEIKHFLQTIINRFEGVASLRKITINSDLDRLYDGYLDKKKIEIVLDNILSNAIKYSYDNSEVHIEAYQIKGKLYFIVRDHGIGISKQDQKRLFKRFYRASNAANHTQLGSGIGLMLTKNLIKMHHGQIQFRSELGKGTICQVMIPIAKEQYVPHEFMVTTPEPSYLASPEPVAHSSTEEISKDTNIHQQETLVMIVEDNDELRNYLLESLGHTYCVVGAANGVEALESIKREKPDFIISDIVMPEMNGLALCEAVKADVETCHIPVVLLTARSERDDFIEGFEAGADDYIAKPFDIEILKKKISITLINRRLFREKYIEKKTIIEKVKQEDEKAQAFLESTMQIIEQNISNDFFTIDILSQNIGMSRSVFYKRLKALTGHNPQEIIKEIKMKKAAELLISGDYLISEISDMTGFPNAKYFSTVFKKYYGKSPSRYLQDIEAQVQAEKNE